MTNPTTRVSWSFRLLALTLATMLATACATTQHAPAIETGSGFFRFDAWAGPAIPVYYHRPASAGADAPIMIVMHGASRDADRYRDEWIAVAEKGNFIVVAPEFSKHKFPKSRMYNLGGVADKDGKPRDESLWTFSAIEPLFDQVVMATGSKRKTYDLYGHSAGSQFVHRYLYYKPDARVDIAFPANAGWYTLPVADVAYPYGLKGSGIPESAVKTMLSRKVIMLLGDQDVLAGDNLRKTPEAMRQGPNRLTRGRHFFTTAKGVAGALGVPLGWEMVTVEKAGHQNGKMAWGVLPFVAQGKE